MPLVWQASKSWLCPGLLLPPGVTPQLCLGPLVLYRQPSWAGLHPDVSSQITFWDRNSTHGKNTFLPQHTSVGRPTTGLTLPSGAAPEADCSQEGGSQQSLFTWDPKHHQMSSCPKDSFSHRAPSWCTKTGLISCCNSANIPPENEIVSSPCWHLQFLCIVLLEHPPSFTSMGKGTTPSPFFPIKKKGNQILHLLIL